MLDAAADPETRRLWLAGPFSVTAYDQAGNRAAHLSTFPHPVRAVAPGPGGATLWLAGPPGLRLVDMTGAVRQRYPSVHADDLARDGQGGLWALSRRTLWRIDPAGQVVVVRRMRPVRGRGWRRGWAVDPADGTLWMATGPIVRHIGGEGSVLGQKTLSSMPPRLLDRLSGIAVYADTFPPTLEVASPANGAFLATHRPMIRLGYDDNGVGADPSSIRAQSAGNALPVDCSGDRTSAQCMPAREIPDGALDLAVTVADFAGNRSQPAHVSFTVDTIPPKITVSSPEDGAWTNDPQPTLAGSVSEPATLTLDGSPLNLDVRHAFRQPLDLTEGSNALHLVAADRAGNRGTAELTVHLDTVPPDPVPGSALTVGTPSNGQVTLSGEKGSVPAGIEVVVSNLDTGDHVTTDANAGGSFSASIAAKAGQSLEIQAVDRAGNLSEALAEHVGPPDPAKVAPKIDPTVSASMAETTAFLYQGSEPVQTGVASGAIEARRAAVIRGKVISRDGTPLPGVLVTVQGHPELGQTLTRKDGRYDLAVNGGGALVLRYSHQGYLTARRQLHAKWQSYLESPTVALVKPDAHVTPVSFGDTSVTQLVGGSLETDAAGRRRAIAVFAPGTQATMEMPDGSTRSLGGGDVRITEYTVGDNGRKAMPARLPDMSGYTYAVDLSIDQAQTAGATRIDFDKPVRLYVRNFLGFPVGGAVPLGWYDPTQAHWVPADNGRIVGVLSLDTDGCALLDVDGSGQPASGDALGSLGIDHAEKCRIGHLYSAGQSFWRMSVSHFTVYDSNWPITLPPGSAPPEEAPHAAGRGKLDSNRDNQCPGCRINAQPQVLTQSIPIAGTDLQLVYSGDRANGYTVGRSIDIPVTGDTVPDYLLSADVTVRVAGQAVHRHFSPDPDQHFGFVWNGRDAYRRKVYGAYRATVTVSYTYPLVYLSAFTGGVSFDMAPRKRQEIGPTFLTTGRTYSLSRTWTIKLQPDIPDSNALGGWMLDVHHAYDPVGHVLVKGDGSHRGAGSVGLVVSTIAGGGTRSPDNVPAKEAKLSQPTDLAVDSAGNLFIATFEGLMEVTSDGRIHELSPNVRGPSTVAVGPDGNLYVGSYDGNTMYRLQPDVAITAIAGNGDHCPDSSSDCGNGGPAIDASLDIEDIAVGHDDTIYLMHEDHFSRQQHLKEITPDGTLHDLLAWSGSLACCQANRVAADRNGGVYYGGWEGPVLRKGPHDKTSNIRPASPNLIADFAQGPDGWVYVLDGSRIWKVGPDGADAVIAGSGAACFNDQDGCGDGGLALDAAFDGDGAGRLAVAPDGAIYVTDLYTNRVRKISPSLPGRSNGKILVPSRDGSKLFYFSPDGRHLRTTSATTGALVYRFGYDDTGRLISITDGSDNVTTIGRDSAGRATAIVAPDGEKTTLQINASDQLVQVTDPAGASWKAGYEDNGLLTSFRDRNGNLDQYTYDVRGRLTKVQEPTGTRWTLHRKALANGGYRVSMTGGDGLTQVFAVHPLSNAGDKLIHTFPDGTGQTRIYNRDGSGEVDQPDGTVRIYKQGADPRFGPALPIPASTTVTTPSGLKMTRTVMRAVTRPDPRSLALGTQTDTITVAGSQYTRTLDVTNHTLSLTTPTGRTVHGTLDDQGRIMSLQVGDLRALHYGRDSRGRLISLTRGSGSGARKLSMSYGLNGYLASVTDPNGRTERFQRDALGRVTRETRPDGSQILFRYDANGNVTAAVPPGRPSHELDYDSHDDLASYAPPAIGGSREATRYHYDASHRLTSVDYPGGATATLDYGSGGQLVGVDTPRGTESYQYDQNTGQLTEISGGGETLDFSWDGFLPTTQSWSGAVSGSVGFTWDHYFRVTGITVAGNDIARAYDKDGLLTKAGQFTLTRDATDGMVDATALGDITGTRQYDQFGALSDATASYQSTALYSAHYQRDATGRIVSRTETIGGVEHTYAYAYDKNGRLLQVRVDGMVADIYTYDANGNRLSNNGTRATYDDRDRLLTYGQASYQYNPRGQLSQKTGSAGTRTYDYDVLGNLREVKLPDGRTIDYVIDGRNRRVGRKVDGKLVQGFLYKDQLNPVAELDGSGNVVARFVYGSKPNVPAYMIKNGKTYRIISDHLGSVRLVLDVSTGEVVQRMDYSPFGKVLKDTNPGFQPFGFAGGIYDPDTGLVRFGARDYDAEAGRWTARDQVLFHGRDTNLYRYVLADPLDFGDPFGHWSFSFGAYAGLGGAVVIGQDPTTGQWFYGGRLGIGLGGGISFDYRGKRPGGGADSNCDHGTTYGDFMSASGSIGPYQWNPIDAHGGYDTTTGSAYHEGPLNNKFAFGNGAGVGIGGAIGVEVIGH
ncbi:MAG TPA: RHS repeat-associated core domain-containing protein [Gammaproteobacteria bacterium]|nr:RHS repeat-associated core domain-containing protein [Gammaproteobacteria bacterium]